MIISLSSEIFMVYIINVLDTDLLSKTKVLESLQLIWSTCSQLEEDGEVQYFNLVIVN